MLFPDELREGRVTAALREYGSPAQPIHAVYPSRRYVSPKLRAFVDFLREEFEIDPVVGLRKDGATHLLAASRSGNDTVARKLIAATEVRVDAAGLAVALRAKFAELDTELPPLLYGLRVEERALGGGGGAFEGGMDFLTILLYTCEASCGAGGEEWAHVVMPS